MSNDTARRPPADIALGGTATRDGHPAWQRLAFGGGGAMFVGMGLGRFSYSAMVPALVATPLPPRTPLAMGKQ